MNLCLRVPSFAVVIPAYNEGEAVTECLMQVEEHLSRLPNRTAILAVDDGSTDQTGDCIRRAANSMPRLELLEHPVNAGYGAAIMTGVRVASETGFDYVLFMDSDLTNDPADIPRFAQEMARGTDVIKASRYVTGGGFEGVPPGRRMLSRIGNGVARWLLRIPLRDCTNGFRAVRTDLLAGIRFRESGFAVIMEELYRIAPVATTYAEIPVTLKTRAGDRRPSAFSYSPRTVARYLRYPVLSRLRRGHRRREPA